MYSRCCENPLHTCFRKSGHRGSPYGYATCRLTCPTDGSYDIDQVPYTMYYWGSLALHGAYWHDDFGKVRSHGCTNLPPHDARWLFRWASPTLPHGWHGRVRARGPHVYMTRGDDVYVDPLPAQRKND